jgi:capsid assembly protease
MSDRAVPEGKTERYPRSYSQIVRVVRETPWAILPGTLATVLDVVGRRIEGERLSEDEIKARVGGRSATRQMQVAGSVAVLPIYGAIIPRATLFSEMSGGTSIETLQADFREALNDEAIKAIVLDIDSPGGMTTGVQELAAELRAGRGQKPIVAVANYRAASAAYHLASQADEVVVAPSGDVGSIGVFAAHEDVSAMQAKLGVKTTLIQAKDSPYKVEGSPLEPLSEEGTAAIQERVDEAYDIFVGDVAKGRGVTVAAVKDGYGKGRMLSASKALAAGMVDRIDTAENVVSRLQNPSGRARVANTSATGAHIVSGDFTNATVLWRPGGLSAGPLAPHKTATTDGPWDGPGNKANLRNAGDEAYYRSAFAWQDDNADATNKGTYKFIHHEVSGDGAVGAANLNGCSQGIAVLNGGRTGTTIPDADRKGVWNHLAKHIRDGGKEPPPLKSLAELEEEAGTFSDAVDEAHRAFEAVVSGAEALRALTGTKREQLTALIERAKGLVAEADEADEQEPGDELASELAVAEANARLRL